jgi:hypothetical protein
MAGTVTTDLALISSCDATTSQGTWSAGTVDTDAKVEGTGCLYVKYTSVGDKAVTFIPTTPLSLAATCVYFWVSWASKAMPKPKALGGLKIKFESDASNWKEWTVAGSDTLPHNGWICHVVKTDTTATSSGGNINWAGVTKLTVTFGLAVKGNVTWDCFRYGTTMTIKGGTSTPGDEATFANMVTADVVNGYGMISLSEGVYYLQGKFQIGSTTNGEATFFKDTSRICAFTDKDVGAAYFGITVVGNSTTETRAYLGVKSGNAGISGCVFKPAGAAKYTFTATNQYITNLGLYGCSFIDAGVISLPPVSGTAREVLNCNFEASAQVIPDTCIVKNCNFVSADGTAIRMASTSHNISYCNFITCPKAIEITAAGTYETTKFAGLMFSGNTLDIDNTSGGAVTINNSASSNPVTYSGTTAIHTWRDMTFTPLIALTELEVYRVSNNALLGGIENSGTSFVFRYENLGGVAVYARVHHVQYEPLSLDLTLPDADSTIPVQQRIDRNYLNP